MNPPSRRERYRGALLGLAAGDALGTTLEFATPGSFTPITDTVGGGPFGLPPGAWTDDTSVALCLAESLPRCRGFDAADQMHTYVRWYRDGHPSSTGHCFNIGDATRAALEGFLETGDPFAGSTDPRTAGNGSLTRLAPVALAYARQPERAVTFAARSSRATHAAETAVDACRYLAALIVGALAGRTKEGLPAADYWTGDPLHPEVGAVASDSFKRRNPPDIRGSGYVVQSLEAALWAFYRTDSFAAGALRAVNLGDDADTTGAVYGQLAGAYYGGGRFRQVGAKSSPCGKRLWALPTGCSSLPAHNLGRTALERQLISTGTFWENAVGYSRAVRVGPHVWVAGTTALDDAGQIVGVGDPYAQTAYILQKIGGALGRAGASLEDVVRTRIFITDASLWEGVGRVHGEVFGAVRPASTMVAVSALVSPEMLVEIEADAFVRGGA